MVQLENIEPLLPGWLVKQRWFQKSDGGEASARIIDSEMLHDGEPALLWTLVEVGHGATYQVPLGLRRRESIGAVLLGHNDALVGDVEINGEVTVVYDALIDSDLSKVLFDLIVDGKETANSVRSMGAEQSNTSLIYDNRLMLKVFRRLFEGANPDLEVTRKLTDHGYQHVKPVIATWERNDHDLAVCQPFLWDGTDGWKMALASVRDFLGPDVAGGSATTGSVVLVEDEASDPGSAGGDFGDEALRLGEVTGLLHIALAEIFPTEEFDPTKLIASLEEGLDSLEAEQQQKLQSLIQELRKVSTGEAGRSTRVHGDYHLGQTLRAVTGWYVMDFEGEPARPLSERNLPNSPIKDVAGMVRSFHYATAAGMAEQMPVDADALAQKAEKWERHNSDRFRAGYLSVPGIDKLLPADAGVADLLFRAFEIEKAIYELHYERAYRPDWVSIPESAIARLLL